MTRWLLDTNTCVAVLNGTSGAVVERLAAESPATVCLCSVAKGELLFGARKSARTARLLERLERFFEPLTSFAFDDGAAQHYGLIRADLERAGAPGANDRMIAAIARQHDLAVATGNVREWGRGGAARRGLAHADALTARMRVGARDGGSSGPDVRRDQ